MRRDAGLALTSAGLSLVGLLGFGVGGSSAWAVEASAESPAGKAIYEQHCVSCHGPQGRGDGPESPYLSPRPASLISAATSIKSDQELLAVIANGKPRTAMPPWKDRLTEAQQQDVLAYVRSFVRFYKPGTPAPPRPPQTN